MKSISLIQALVLVDQGKPSIKPVRSRNRKIDYFEATEESLASAQKLADQILGRDLSIPALETRVLLLLIEEMVEKACGKKLERSRYRFSFENILAYTGWQQKIVKVCIEQLTKLGYVRRHAESLSLLYKGKSVQIVQSGIKAFEDHRTD